MAAHPSFSSPKHSSATAVRGPSHSGPVSKVEPQLPRGIKVRNYGKDALISAGCVYCTVYPQSVDALFEEAEKLGMRLAAGKVLMRAYYVATRGTAQAMYLEDKIGSLAPGMEADLVVLDMRSAPIIDRMDQAKEFSAALCIQMMIGDDRAVQAACVADRALYQRPEQGTVRHQLDLVV